VAGARRRRDHLEVVAVGEHRATATSFAVAQDRIDVPRRRDLESLQPARKLAGVVGFDQQMDMRALQADVHDPDPLTDRGNDRRLAHRPVHQPAPQAADRRHDAQHDVQCMIRLHVGPLLVARSRALSLRRTPGTLALATSTEQLLLHVPLARPPRPRLRHPQQIATLTVNGKLISRI